MLAIPADNSFIFAVFSECRFSIPAPESHRSVALLTLYRRGFRKVISYSDGHSVVGQLFALTLINWEFIFDLNEVNFVNFPQMTKRAGTQHIKSAGDDLSPYL